MIGDVHTFWVPGPPEGKKAVVTWVDPDTGKRKGASPSKPYMKLVGQAALYGLKRGLCLDGPVGIRLTVVCPRTKALLEPGPAKRLDLLCAVKPDASNVLKGVEDGCKGVLPNDSRIAHVEVCKMYADPGMDCGVLVELTELDQCAPPEVLDRVRQFLRRRR